MNVRMIRRQIQYYVERLIWGIIGIVGSTAILLFLYIVMILVLEGFITATERLLPLIDQFKTLF